MNRFAEIPSITFFFPYYEVSGVPVLFLRMAEYLADRFGLETYVVDYADGYMSRTIRPGSSVKVRIFNDGVPINIPSDTILVLQSVLPYTMRPELKISDSTRIIFWTLHPMNLVQTIIPLPLFRHLQSRYPLFHRAGTLVLFPLLRHKLRDLVISLHENKSLFFMDGSTLKSTSECLRVVISDQVFVPVPSDDATVNFKKNHLPDAKKGLNICWVGRLTDFKIHILVYAMQKLREYAILRQLPVTVHIIGDGPDGGKLDKFKTAENYFKMNNVGVLSKEDLDAYLVKHIDVLMAMGTSALEGARLGVPTVLLDISYGPVADGYKFKWISEAKDYNLGETIDSSHFEEGNITLQKIIDDVLHDYEALSERTYSYYLTHHAISSVSEKFIDAVRQASFKYSDFKPEIFDKGIIRRSYETIRCRYARPAYSLNDPAKACKEKGEVCH